MRLISIDVLRGVAVLLVLFRHFEIVEVLGRIGWSGVDLFFVVSGFLVSGLLFTEYKKKGEVKPYRFLIRRGLKIYPAFYVFVFFTLIKFVVVDMFGLEGNKNFLWSNFFSEIFFVQNYFGKLWAHTWSLGVEEHFYFLLLLLIMILISKMRLDDAVLFRNICLIVAIICPLIRGINYLKNPFTIDTHLYYTHLRIDSLFFGVLLSYFYHFKEKTYLVFVSRHKWLILLVSLLCLSIMFIFSLDSFFMNTVGLSLIYIGFGALLVLGIYNEKTFHLKGSSLLSMLAKPFAFVGYYSYSIYLWHLAVLVYLVEPFFKDLNKELSFAIYIAGSIIVGVVVNKLIEKPILQFRNQRFPNLNY